MKHTLILGLNTDQLLAAIAILLTVMGGMWYVISMMYNRYFIGGRLTIQLIQKSCWSAPQNVIHPAYDSEGYVDRHLSIVRHHLTFRYDLVITNNSDHTAYFPRIYFANGKMPFVEMEKLNEHEPIVPGIAKTIFAVLHEASDTLPTERKKGEDGALVIKDLEILIEYQNNHKARFYSLFNASIGITKFYQYRPKFKS